MEADIIINGVKLTDAQAMTLRVAIGGWLMDLQNPDHLGTDEHGRFMTAAYRLRASEIQDLIFLNLTPPRKID